MRIEVGKRAGFCFGVRRAIDLAVRTLAERPGKKVVSLGELIHNPQTVEQLSRMGLTVVESLDEVQPGATLIIRSHGVAPGLVEQIRQRGLEVVDATCPDVRRAQEGAARLRADGYQVVIVGDEGHPEVEALRGAAGPGALVVDSPEAVAGLPLAPRVGVVAQTTQPPAKVAACVEALRRRVPTVEALKTTCPATERRQEEAAAMAKRHRVIVVVGGRNSANTTKLAEIARSAGARVYHVEHGGELKAEWFSGEESVGVTAGASTPDWVIEEVVDKMAEFDREEQQGTEAAAQTADAAEVPAVPAGETAEPGPAPAAEAAAPEADEPHAEESVEEGRAQMEAALQGLKRHSRVIGRVTKVEQDKVYVDIGAKTDGMIPLRELTFRPVSSASEVVSEGDEVEVVVLRPENEQGEAVLSKRRVDEEQAWAKLAEAKETGEPVEALITERVKGGLVADVGVRGFIPGSQVSREFIEDLSPFVGQRLKVKVLEVDRGKRNVILSRRQVIEEEAERAKEEALQKLEVGAVVPGVIKRLTSFGAFVDVGGVEGLLHVSEMAWGRVKHPSEVVKEGQQINVKVLKVDRESGRVSLGLRQTLPDPWTEAAAKYKPGQVVPGEIVRVVDFGAFVRLEDGVEGLVHVSQLAPHRVEKASDVVKPGQAVEVKVLHVDPERKRISLSIRQALPPAPKESRTKEKAPETMGTADVPTPTLGDVFGHMFAEGGFAPAKAEATEDQGKEPGGSGEQR
ncbi:MAG TPA: bifunctional 4-hydroxy-3-methylbut-2-enyl diphosphate reductase/30S ribosomal protein S1 [Firmicutes bacterium]|nr:bifunctional 4-hydroxy-3-methylbut-2-enyl diphosphate reductase/30S ribosomal protein S1 [Bacillota bacterium]